LTTSSFIFGMKQHSYGNKSSPKRQSSQPKRAAPDPAHHLAASLQQQLDKLPLDALARASGFRRRQPKKLTPRLFVQAACLLVTPILSLVNKSAISGEIVLAA
jgi:hypothetical protein